MPETFDEPRKPKGWFSRRYQTNEAHLTARLRYLSRHGRTARRLRTMDRAERAAAMPIADHQFQMWNNKREYDRKHGALNG